MEFTPETLRDFDNVIRNLSYKVRTDPQNKARHAKLLDLKQRRRDFESKLVRACVMVKDLDVYKDFLDRELYYEGVLIQCVNILYLNEDFDEYDKWVEYLGERYYRDDDMYTKWKVTREKEFYLASHPNPQYAQTVYRNYTPECLIHKIREFAVECKRLRKLVIKN